MQPIPKCSRPSPPNSINLNSSLLNSQCHPSMTSTPYDTCSTPQTSPTPTTSHSHSLNQFPPPHSSTSEQLSSNLARSNCHQNLKITVPCSCSSRPTPDLSLKSSPNSHLSFHPSPSPKSPILSTCSATPNQPPSPPSAVAQPSKTTTSTWVPSARCSQAKAASSSTSSRANPSRSQRHPVILSDFIN